MGEIITNNGGKFSFDDLDNISNRLHAILYLAEIYKMPSSEKLTALDHKNIYNIFYVLSLPDFGKVLQTERVGLANQYLSKVKSGKEKVEDLIDELMFTGHYN